MNRIQQAKDLALQEVREFKETTNNTTIDMLKVEENFPEVVVKLDVATSSIVDVYYHYSKVTDIRPVTVLNYISRKQPVKGYMYCYLMSIFKGYERCKYYAEKQSASVDKGIAKLSSGEYVSAVLSTYKDTIVKVSISTLDVVDTYDNAEDICSEIGKSLSTLRVYMSQHTVINGYVYMKYIDYVAIKHYMSENK